MVMHLVAVVFPCFWRQSNGLTKGLSEMYPHVQMVIPYNYLIASHTAGKIKTFYEEQ